MFQLRIYTLGSRDALHRYATTHWARHVATFAAFGIETHGVWTEHAGDTDRLVALIRYPPDADPDDLARQIMSSREFASDMEGFEVEEIVDVAAVLLDPTSYSPIQ